MRLDSQDEKPYDTEFVYYLIIYSLLSFINFYFI